MILLIALASAVPREDALQTAAEYTTHVWSMTAVNETASCSDDYESDFTAGTHVAVPYDWGGWYTLAEFDDAIADGEGAGSHSWHGVLSCTAGVDCSGFVSQVWETDIKYGTSTIHEVSHGIDVEDLERADALNDAGSHIVLFAYETAAGLPVHYEAGGDPVLLDSDQGWSAFSAYEPIRYDDIEAGESTGTVANPVVIDALPFQELRWTAGAASDAFDTYACSHADESGPEVVYRLDVAEAGKLRVLVADDDGVDVDVHVLTDADEDACVARDDTGLLVDVEAGPVWIVVDTYVSHGQEYPGPYTIAVTMDDGAADTGDAEDTAVADDTGGDDGTGRPGRPRRFAAPEDDAGACGCGTGAGVGIWGALAGLAAVRRRR